MSLGGYSVPDPASNRFYREKEESKPLKKKGKKKKTDANSEREFEECEFGSESVEEALRVLINHAKECQERYGISGDAVIEMGEMVLARFKEKGK